MTRPDFRAALKQLADAVDGWEVEPAADDPLAIAMDHARKVLFPRLASLMQEPTAFELGDLPPPVAAKPVNLAELHDPDFSDGLTASQHLDVLRGGPDPRAAAAASPGLPKPEAERVLRLAEIINKVGLDYDSKDIVFSAAPLAEAILAHPGFSGCHDGPVAPAAQGEVDELVAALEADAECVAAEQSDLMQLTDKQLTRIAQLLKASAQPADADPDFSPESAAQGVLDDRYEFSVVDSDDCEQAGGSAPTLDDAIREGRNYLRQYNQDGPHKLELRRVLVLNHSEATNA
jgi:hypothetical protein